MGLTTHAMDTHAAMHKVTIGELENEPRPPSVRKHATEPLGLDDFALNYFELDPGESISGGLHTHMNQEEAFYIIEGTATFETRDDTVEVGEDEIIRFAAGEYQEGRNESDDRVRVIALGAPQSMGETRSALECRDCGHDYHTVEPSKDHITLICPGCGHQFDV